MKNIHSEEMCSYRMPEDILRRRMNRVIREELTPRQREILIAYYLQEKNMPQIAEELQISVSSVCRTLHRAENRLKKFLKY